MLVAVLAGTACGGPDEYRPLGGGEFVRMSVYGYSAPFLRDGVEYRAEAEAHLRDIENTSAFGIRQNEGGEYLPDTFIVESGSEQAPLRCYLWKDSYPEDDLLASRCRTPFLQAEPGQEVHVWFNEFHGSAIVMPEGPALSSPEQDSELSVSSGEDLVLSWEPVGKGDEMRWSLQPVDINEPSVCRDDVSWDDAWGYVGDEGSFVVPSEVLPADLPAGGCQVSLYLSRGREGTLDPGIPQGSITGFQLHKVQMMLKP
ncbi:hypothetical protein SOCE26_065490 [Sorangium cellulosum]|uniref:Uncharacterized protein n=1 Tax=Sorangium cellulosum TaxID=56 RepID=A0A2L0F0H0_SORCE|nr:hypothetical protein [Sorangium cellulosum]AUX45068.1 hypothetical protein SOCE26_065490 [Sorangium cellulosum]